MTLTGPDTHTIRSDTSAILRDGFELMQIVGIDARLARLATTDARDTTSYANAAYSDYRLLPQTGYHMAGLGAVAYELWVSGQEVTIKAILDALWFDYTEDQLASIGFAHLRAPERAAAMRTITAATRCAAGDTEHGPHHNTHPGRPDSAHPTPNAAERHRAWNVYRAEYQRLNTYLHKRIAPIDDTPVTANHRASDRPSVKAIAAAANSARVKAIAVRKMEFLNAVVAAGLMVENRKRHGNYDVLNGILADDKGHRAGDETHLATSLARDIAIRDAPGNFLSRKMVHNRRYKGAPAMVGLTVVVTVAGPNDNHDMATLAVGVDLHHPTGGHGPGIANALRHAENNGLRPAARSNEVQMFIGDGGYHDTKGDDTRSLLEVLTASGYGRVVKPAMDRNLLHQIGRTKNADGTLTQGLVLFHGRLLSPGVGIDWLRSIDHIRETPDAWKEDDVRIHAILDARLNAAVLPTNGRPTIGPDRPRGGQGKGASDKPRKVAHVSVSCPMVRGLGRCHLFDEFDDPAYLHLTPLTGSPDDLPADQRPAVCTNNSGQMRVKIPMDAFATWQENMPGTFAWTDWYTGPRAAVERWNGFLKSRYGPDMTLGAIPVRRAGLWSFLTTLAIVAANRRSLEAWDNRVIKNGGRIPAPPAKAVRANRARVLAQTGVTFSATPGGSRGPAEAQGQTQRP